MTTPDEERRRVEDDRAAVERARQVAQRISETLTHSRELDRTALPRLRRAGLIR